MSTHTQRSAFSLIEAAIVLGVIGLVLGGIWIATSSMSDSRKITNTARAILQVASAAKANIPASMWSNSSSQDITTTAISMGLIPKDFIQNGSFYNPWGGTMSLKLPNGAAGVCASGSNNERLEVVVRNIPEHVCRRLITNITANFRDTTDLCDVHINVTASGPSYDYSSFPMSSSTPACTGGVYFLSFVFRMGMTN